ncbi:hypothetical protein J6524_08965 [Bradyrhizobium sp. WSM 1738]|uniref:hypothetical protein n=1 Tax=Bradyrhizobium hereditatis TaxID=2821405 RepID=UPI001CE35FB5|nr:hypothetical protein [Bradyrhizobium hereditatis]MCA6115037.1 hypothetical protein [Bradyrhizobium hereditatis]
MSRISSYANPAILSCALVSSARASDALAEPMTRSTAAIGAKMYEGRATALNAFTYSGLIADMKTTLSLVEDVCDPQQTAESANRQAMGGVRASRRQHCSSWSVPSPDVYVEAGELNFARLHGRR